MADGARRLEKWTATVQTTDATQTTILNVPLADDHTGQLRIKVTGQRTTALNRILWRQTLDVMNYNGAMYRNGHVAEAIALDAWDVAVVAATASFDVKVTGDANTIRWTIEAELFRSEVAVTVA